MIEPPITVEIEDTIRAVSVVVNEQGVPSIEVDMDPSMQAITVVTEPSSPQILATQVYGLVLVNGADGEQGAQGAQGTQGPPGDPLADGTLLDGGNF